MAVIKAHGAVYTSVADAEARIAELDEGNRQYGASDGRVTEINTIRAALDAHKAQQARYAPAVVLGPLMSQYVNESERRIREIEADKSRDDGKWRYLMFQDANERRTRREYKTELGFLKGYVKAARAGHDILIAE
jgi:hypothetical protein